MCEIQKIGMPISEWHYREYVSIRSLIDDLYRWRLTESKDFLEDLEDQMYIALRKFNYFQMKEGIEQCQECVAEIDDPDFEAEYYKEKRERDNAYTLGRLVIWATEQATK